MQPRDIEAVLGVLRLTAEFLKSLERGSAAPSVRAASAAVLNTVERLSRSPQVVILAGAPPKTRKKAA